MTVPVRDLVRLDAEVESAEIDATASPARGPWRAIVPMLFTLRAG